MIPAAGLGTRLGPGEPKALRWLAGASLLVHAVRGVCQATSVACVVVAAPVGRSREVSDQLTPEAPDGVRLIVVEGGDSRQHSVALALAATPAEFEIVLVHDAARAFAPPDLVDRVAAKVRSGAPAVIPVRPVTDTVKQVDAAGRVVATIDRAMLRAVQTPQGFRRDVLIRAHQSGAAITATDDAALVEGIGVDVCCVAGADEALKITRPADLIFAEAVLAGAPARAYPHHDDYSEGWRRD